MPKRNRTTTVRVPLSLDPTTDKILQELASIGPFGRNKAQVAANILSRWIWDNEEKLARRGIEITRKKGSTRMELSRF